MESARQDTALHIELCNNILNGDIKIVHGALNIKYAMNGTGKSTIAKAIRLASQGKPLSALTPFELPPQLPATSRPILTGTNFLNVMVFDEEYISRYIFQPAALIKDTFEIFVRNPEYDQHVARIEAGYKHIMELFEQSGDVQQLMDRLTALCDLVKTNSDGVTISKRAAGTKSVFSENKGALFVPPEGLEDFDIFISDNSTAVDWAIWKLDGALKYGTKGRCPFCAERETKEKIAQSELFAKCYSRESITFTSKLKACLEQLAAYINPNKLQQLLNSLSIDADRAVLEREMGKLIMEARYIQGCLLELSRFSGYSIDREQVRNLASILEEKKIELTGLDYFNTDTLFAVLEPVNEQIRQIIITIGDLQAEIGQMHFCLHKQITDQKRDINEFLASAGFRYTVDIVIDGENQARAVLRFAGNAGEQVDVNRPVDHLSWGERNALALVLFMFDAISKNADLIVLDDPISSFDSTKKYALMNRLFLPGDRARSLYMRTVLMLTHDMEPLIDYIQVGGKIPSNFVYGHFLQNLAGQLTEFSIEKNKDIYAATVLMKEAAKDDTIPIPARIGFLRKYIEQTVKNPASESISYNILSSLIHGRKTATFDEDGLIEICKEDRDIGDAEIREYIPTFDYSTFLESFEGTRLLDMFLDAGITSAYYKLLILRMYIRRDSDALNRLKNTNDVLRKYVDESFHIENDYLFLLDFRSFAIVPEYVSRSAQEYVKSEIALKKK